MIFFDLLDEAARNAYDFIKDIHEIASNVQVEFYNDSVKKVQ